MAETLGRWRATYSPGRWLLLSGPASLVVLEPAPAHASALVGDLWESVAAAESLPELAERLAAAGFDVMPSLAAFFWTSDGMRSLVRGAITVLDCASGESIARGEGVQIWNEVGLGEVTAVEIVVPDEPAGPALQLPLVVGAAQASSVILDASEEAQVRSAQGVAAALGLVPETGEPPLAEASPEPVAAEPSPSSDSDQAGEAAASAEPGGDRSAAESVVPTEIVGSRESVAEAMFRNEDADTEPWPAPTPLPGSVPAAGESTAGQEAAEGESASSFADDPTALLPPIGEDGTTAGPSAMVMGVLCRQGHSNPPAATTCRVCADAVPDQAPRPLPRPTLARLRTSDGAVVSLDRPVLIGRAPAESSTASVLPRLLTVPSPQHDISRTHLLLAPDGWDLVATDLHSTNGTVIARPDRDRRELLRPDQPTPIPLGTRIELGDGVTVVVEQPG